MMAATNDQKAFAHLNAAGEQVKQANELLSKNTGSPLAASRATALLLSAIARIYVLETAKKYNLQPGLFTF